MTSFNIDKYTVGDGYPPIFLPDIGTFFNQDLKAAEQLINDIKKSGAKIIKGEILQNKDIAVDDETLEKYYSAETGIIEERYREVIERKVVSLEEYENLFAVCKKLDMPFVLSVYDIEGTDFARQIGACALKIASSNIVHGPLIKYAASTSLPIIIDTGKSTMEEIARAVQWARDAGSGNLIVEHSPEAPPSSLENHNMRMLQTLKQAFDSPVGLSDHHAGEEMLYAATAMGAHILEKGVCPDDTKVDQDSYHALPVGKLAEVLTKCNNIFTALGSHMRHLPRGRNKPSARMGLVARKNITKGDKVTLESTGFAFPARGIPVEFWDDVAGWEFTTEFSKDSIIEWKHVRAVSS